MHVGLQIKAVREAKKITKEEMADCLGVCLNTYKSIEYCKRLPNLEEAKLIAEKLEIDPSTFFSKDSSTVINQGDNSNGIGNVIINDKELILSFKHTIDRLSEILEKMAK
jgi:transcriptional regulator with XRE-family HTH domain